MHRNLGLHYLHCQGCPPFPIGWTPPHSPHSGEPTHYPREPLLPWCDSNAAGLLSYNLQTWDPTGKGTMPWTLMPGSQVCCRGSFHASKVVPPWIPTAPCHVPSPACSGASMRSGTSLPPGSHISCTHSETPIQMRNQSSSNSSCSHCLDSDADSHESKGSGSLPGGQSDGEQDGKTNKSVSDHSGGEESDGDAEEQDKSGQQDNTQEVCKSSGNETSSETESSKVPTSEVAKSAIIELDSEDSKSSSESDSRGTHPQFPHPRRKERRPNLAWHNHPHCHSWTQNCQKSSRRKNGTTMLTP